MKEERIKFILISIAGLFMIAFCLFPFIFMFIISISQRSDFFLQNVEFNFTFKNYNSILAHKTLHFLEYLKNSLIISFISAGVAVYIASLSAYAFTRFKFPGKAIVLFLILAVSLFPQISLVGYLFKFMTELKWVNTYQALIFPYIAWVLPLAVWILTSYFSQIPKDLDKAGLIDGCTHFQIFTRIILAVARPAIFSVFLLCFIFSFNEFMFALILTTDFKARTIPVGIALFQGLHGEIPWGEIMAASVIAILPLIILVFIFQNQIISGLTKGAIKG